MAPRKRRTLAYRRRESGRASLDRILDTGSDSSGKSGFRQSDFFRRIFLRWAYAGDTSFVLRDEFLPDGASDERLGGKQDTE